MTPQLLFAVALHVVAATALAKPFMPTDDAQVLERLPARPAAQARELDRLRDAARAAPADPVRAAALAEAWYAAARAEGDPRYLGYAQAALARWWDDADAPAPVLLARATILQSTHDFDRALADLDRVLAREPRHARALLVRATLRTVQGRYDDARRDCARLYGVAPELYVLGCVATIDSLTGRAAAATALLQRALAAGADDVPGRAYAESLQGELAHRTGDAAAERHFRAALAADPRDLYTRGAYADWLLDQGRAQDVVALVGDDTRVDALLLRLALAQHALGNRDAATTIATLRARFAASRARGDTVHRREEARCALWLDDDAPRALTLAKENWNVQREPADLRILAEAAAATHDAAALQVVRDWLAATRLEYAAVRRVAAGRSAS
ncbi:MAG: tetratricopeptide repeat protein [Burkholderiales bacterium]